MTYEEFKKVTEFLDIKKIQVVVHNGSEYNNFKKLDLFSDQESKFKQHDFYKSVSKGFTKYTIWTIDITDDFDILDYRDIMDEDSVPISGEDLASNNRIVLKYSKFIDLIS